MDFSQFPVLFFLLYFWVLWIFVAACMLSLVEARLLFFSCSGFSCCRAQTLGSQVSVVAALGLSSCSSRALDHRLSSCGSWAQLLHGMWISLDQGWNPCPLHWQADSYSLYHQGSPQLLFHESAKAFQWRKDCLVNKWCWNN